MNPSVQWITLLWMLFSGAAMGVAFDSYRVLSVQLRFPKWSKHTLDLLYWIAAAFFIFRMLYATNQGQLRFYVFVGLFIGVWIYFLLWSVITQRFVVMLIQVTKSLLSFVYKLFRILIWSPIKGILMFLFGCLTFLWKFILALLRFVLKCLMPFWRLLQWMLRPITSRLRLPAWSKRWADKVIKAWKRWF